MPHLDAIDQYLSRQVRGVILSIGVVCVGLLMVVDFLTGFEISFAIAYVLPVSLVAWYAGRTPAIVLSVISAVAWEEANRWAGQTFSSPAIPFWNTATRLGFFLIISILLARLKQALEHEQAMSRTDPLTGAHNRRAFDEAARTELARAKRYGHALTVVYIDVDDFKSVNDRFGHDSGDALLCTVAKILQVNLRITDTVARLGGDEFVILLPETDANVAAELMSRIHQILTSEMRRHGWPVSFSVGVLTCLAMPQTTGETLKMADDLMYAAKNGGKNAVSYRVYAG